MKKALGMILLPVLILTIGVYVYSQDDVETTQKKESSPIATVQTTRKLLTTLDAQLIDLQKKIAEHSERLAGVFAKWKQAGKIKQTEQWNQVKSGIHTLLSEVKMITQSFERIEKLRRNKELFDILTLLVAESEKITPQIGDMKYIMQLTSLYGKSIFNDKILEKIARELKIEAPKKEEKLDFGYGTFEGFDDSSFNDSSFNDSSFNDSSFDFDSDFDNTNFDTTDFDSFDFGSDLGVDSEGEFYF